MAFHKWQSWRDLIYLYIRAVANCHEHDWKLLHCNAEGCFLYYIVKISYYLFLDMKFDSNNSRAVSYS